MKLKRVFDLNQPLYNDCPCWPTIDPPKVERMYYFPRHEANVEMLHLITHSGTHVDAPYHKLPEGRTLDQIPVETWIGEGIVADLTSLGDRELITAERLEGAAAHMHPGDMVMLYTGWSNYRGFTQKYLKDWPALDKSGAQWLVDHQAKVVGTEALAVDLYDAYLDPEEGLVAHKVLLGAGVLLVEELRLAEIGPMGPRRWTFFCLPMAIQGAGGAPARVIAVDEG